MRLTPLFIRAGLLVSATGLSAVAAQANEAQPVFSAPYTVSDALAAYVEIDARWDQAQSEQQARFLEFDGDPSAFIRSDPILQHVSWEHDTCNDLISLIPPPQDGWGLRSDASFVEIPVTDTRAQVEYVRYAPDMGSADEGFFSTEQSVSVTFSLSPDTVQFFEMMSQEALRDVSFDPGPYNYPLFKYSNKTILGDVTVDVTATLPEDARLYLQEIIGCAIKSGMIAASIDPSTLGTQP